MIVDSKQQLDLIKASRSLLVDYVNANSRQVLVANGSRLVGTCFLHPDNNRGSLSVYNKNGVWLWHCFAGCQRGGSVIDALVFKENIDIPTAIKQLKQKLGLKNSGVYKSQQRYYKQVAKAKKLAVSKLSQPALDYLKQRGFTKQTIEDFEVGLTQYSFVDCLAIPLKDEFGVSRGFFYRSLPNQAKKIQIQSKNNGVYEKSINLFALDRVLKTKNKLCYITESVFDAMACWQLDIPAVAVGSTNLTALQLQKIIDYKKIPVLLFDSDQAGHKATIKHALNFAYISSLGVIKLPTDYKDTNDWLISNPTKLQALTAKPVWVFDFLRKELAKPF